MKHYNKRLSELRTDHDLTQKAVSEICNVSDASVGHWEKGVREISIDCLIKLAKFYNVSVDYILGLTDNKQKFW